MKDLKTVFVAICSLIVFLLSGCGEKKEEITSLEDLNRPGLSIGYYEGQSVSFILPKVFPHATLQSFNDPVTGYEALRQGKLAGFAYERLQMEQAIVSGFKGVRLLPETLGDTVNVAVGISRASKIPDLKEKINAFIRECNENGILSQMRDRWLIQKDTVMPEIPRPEKPELVLHVGTSGVVPPYSYYSGTELTGFDIEWIRRFALWLNADARIKIYDYNSIVAAAVSGNIDCIVANLNETRERKEKIDFSDPLTQVINAVMVKKGENSTLQIRTLADLNHPNVKMGVPSGTAFDLISQKHYPQAEVFYLNGFCDVIPALRQKIVDAALFDEPVARDICRQNRDLTYIRENVESVYFALGFSKTERGVKLCSQINEFLNKLKENGTLADVEKLWVDGEESQKKIDKTGLSGKNGTLRLLTPSNYAPFTYVQDGEVVGYEMDLLYRFAREYGYQIEILVMEPSAVISGLVAGKGDLICGGVSYTAERAEKILFSVPTYETGIVALVRASTIPEENGLFLTDEKSTWHSNLSESFERTFVRESRWKLVLDGIRITIFISIFSAIFGTLLGFGICLLRRSGNRLVNIIALSYIRVMQGTPMIVLLMILFYIVFAKTGLDGVWVAVIGFGLNFAAYVSEMMRTGIESVDKGQMEAALALGYRKPHAFLKIVLPQAARHFLPVYQGEFISLVKMTSVVGYIAIQDLTKASDIIRSRTYEAFFPLISTAIIYFIIAWLLTRALVALQDRLNPKKRRKKLFSK